MDMKFQIGTAGKCGAGPAAEPVDRGRGAGGGLAGANKRKTQEF